MIVRMFNNNNEVFIILFMFILKWREYRAQTSSITMPQFDHDPEHKELRFGVASKAETVIDLSEPLIQSPGDFMLSITKFKIDTECIPLLIPEMQQPQDLTSKYVKQQDADKEPGDNGLHKK